MHITSLISDAQFDVNLQIHCSTSEPVRVILLLLHFCGFALHAYACWALMCITSLISDAQFDVNLQIHCSTSEPLCAILLSLHFVALYCTYLLAGR